MWVKKNPLPHRENGFCINKNALGTSRYILERYIVVHIRQIGCRSGGGRGWTRLRGTRLALWRGCLVVLGTARTVIAALIAPAQHLHLVGDDVGAVAIGAGILVLPLAGFKTAFHVDRTPFLQVFAGDFGQAVVEDRRSTRLNSSHTCASRMPSSA